MISRLATICLLAAILPACDRKKPPASPRAQTVSAADARTAKAPSKPSASPAPADAHEMLASMDSRTPVPLTPMMANHQKQQMREHLEAVQRIMHAAATEDFAGVEKAAAAIGSSPEMAQMCRHMGAGAEGFTEQALKFHHTADGIAEAARAKDSRKVAEALDRTLATCTNCHSRFKQQVVTENVWAEKTGMGAPSGAMHHHR